MSESINSSVGSDSLFVRTESNDDLIIGGSGMTTIITTPMLASSFRSIRDSFKRSDSTTSSQIGSIFGTSNNVATSNTDLRINKNGEFVNSMFRVFFQLFVFIIWLFYYLLFFFLSYW